MEDNTHAGQGPVVLDIGGDIGALVVSMPSDMEGIEIEICPAGVRPGGHVPHVAVVARPAASGVHYSAVFPRAPCRETTTSTNATIRRSR